MALTAALAMGAMSMAGSVLSSKMAASNAKAAMEDMQPRDVFTPLGALTFEDGRASFAPTGALKDISRQALAEAAVPSDVFAQKRLGALEALAAPREQEQMRLLKEELFGQGRAGTASALREIRDVRELFNRAAMQRQIAAEDLGFTRQQALIDRGINTILRPMAGMQGLSTAGQGAMSNIAHEGLRTQNQILPRAVMGAGIGLGQQLGPILGRKLESLFSGGAPVVERSIGAG